MRCTESYLSSCALAIMLFASCGPKPDSDLPDATPSGAEVEAAAACDPIVDEYRELMADYEKGLQDMVDARKVDQTRQNEWSARAQELTERVRERGERELGLKCWQEFNAISQAYAPRVADLAMKLAMIQLEQGGVDPAMLEQMKNAAGR